jgi:plasmid stabilization system protein ParE
VLSRSISGWGTNEKLIISILAHRDAAQRRAIRRWYADAYGEELLRALSDEIHGKFEVSSSLRRIGRPKAPSARSAVVRGPIAIHDSCLLIHRLAMNRGR